MLSEKKMKFLQIEMHYGEKISSGFELHCKKKKKKENLIFLHSQTTSLLIVLSVLFSLLHK